MLDYLISLLNFTVEGTTYNLLTTPWACLYEWCRDYLTHVQNASYSSQLREAYYMLAKLGFFYAILVCVLIGLCVFFVYKIASGFTGWFRFR